jgi:hypothetical protein
MTDRAPMPRFTVRRGIRGFMVWDRERRGPAQLNGQPFIDLRKEEATATKDDLEARFAGIMGLGKVQ